MLITTTECPHRARLRAGLDSYLSERRWTRDRETLRERHADERAAIDAAARGGQHNRRTADAARAALAVRHRDEWKRAADYPLRPEVALHALAAAADRVGGAWTADERGDAAAALMLRLALRHGWGIPASALAGGYVERALSGLMLNERDRAARALSLDALQDESDEWSDDDAAARDAAVSRNVWAVASLDPSAPVDPQLRGGSLAAALALADPRMRHRDCLTALAAAANGYGSGAALAAATGISAENARQRLTRGRRRIAAAYPDAAALADALAVAARRLPDRDRIALTATEREAARMVEGGKRPAAREAARVHALRSDSGTRGPVWRHRRDRTALALAALGACRMLRRRPGCFPVALALARLAAAAALPVRVEWIDAARVRPYRAASRLRVALAVTVPAPPRAVLSASAPVPGRSVNPPRVRSLRPVPVWTGAGSAPLPLAVSIGAWSEAYDAALRVHAPGRTVRAAAVLAARDAAAAVR